MLGQLVRNSFRLDRISPGASLIEISVSLMLISLVAVGFVGSTAVGARVGSHIEDQDTSLIAARSQAEFIASEPVALSFGLYGVYPSAPSAFTVTGDVTNDCQTRDFLQCTTIRVSRDEKERIVLDAFKAERFVKDDSTLAPNAIDVVPASGGLERVKTITVTNPLPKDEGFAVIISKVLAAPSSTDVLVRWESNVVSRLLTIYSGRPFGAQTTGLTTLLTDVSSAFPVVSEGALEKNERLGIAVRGIAAGDYTVYFFNDSKFDLATTSADITCLCEIEP